MLDTGFIVKFYNEAKSGGEAEATETVASVVRQLGEKR